MTSNADLLARRTAAVPRGVATAFPVFADRAENAELWDVEGKRYVDFAGGIAVLNTGHRHPKVMAAVEAQMARFTHTAFQVNAPTSPTSSSPRSSTPAPPSPVRPRRSSSPPAARRWRTRVKIARAHTGRSGVITFTGAFHGRTMLTMAMTGKVAPYKKKFGPMPAEVWHLPFPNELHGVTVEQSLQALNFLFRADVEPERVAAIVVEPVQGEGGFYETPTAMFQALRKICDEMGLGKTLQALVYLSLRKSADAKCKPSLVVCPTSVVTNWQAEAARFTPELRTLVLHGPKRHASFSAIDEHDLVITSYALLRRDVEQYAALKFDTVILDEAQHIKNRFSQNAQAVKSLKAERRFVLTGTPMENSLYDLWSIFDFLMPGYLGPATEFRSRYEIPIAKDSDEAAMRRLRQRLRPFVLRRMKTEVASDLPAKIEQVTLCEMTDEQKAVYQSLLDQGRREVFEHAGKGSEVQRRFAVLTALMRLRQACCHLDLLPALENRTWREPSAKLEMGLELIEEARDGGHRVLVFSQFVRLLKLVEAALREREIAFCYLDGSTVDRAGEVRRFQNSPDIPVFLISLKAGGTGLNLTGADTVIHFDPWWNPAVEDQATGRAPPHWPIEHRHELQAHHGRLGRRENRTLAGTEEGTDRQHAHE